MRQFAAIWLLGTTLLAAGAGAQGFVWHGDRIRAEVRAENVRELNFAIFDGEPKPEAELVRLWSEHAQVSE